jgi:effector-binding domain-containing protein
MQYPVNVQRVDSQLTAVVRRRARQKDLATVIPQGCGEVWEFVRSAGLPHPGRNLALYLDLEMNLECGVEVTQPFDGNGGVVCSSTPGGSVATTVHLGPYHLLGEAHEAIHHWCTKQELTLAGPFWELYGHWTDDPAKLRTDVFYLLQDRAKSAD